MLAAASRGPRNVTTLWDEQECGGQGWNVTGGLQVTHWDSGLGTVGRTALWTDGHRVSGRGGTSLEGAEGGNNQRNMWHADTDGGLWMVEPWRRCNPPPPHTHWRFWQEKPLLFSRANIHQNLKSPEASSAFSFNQEGRVNMAAADMQPLRGADTPRTNTPHRLFFFSLFSVFFFFFLKQCCLRIEKFVGSTAANNRPIITRCLVVRNYSEAGEGGRREGRPPVTERGRAVMYNLFGSYSGVADRLT